VGICGEVIAQLPVPACLLREGVVFLANRAFAGLTGYRPEELDGRPWEEMVHPGDRPEVASLVSGQVAEGVFLRLLTGDGNTVSVRCHAAVLFDGDQKFLAIQAVDVSDLRRAAEDTAQRYEDLLHNISDIVHVHSLEEGRLLYINPAFHQLFGYRVQDWPGRPIRDLLVPRFRHLYGEYARKLSENGHHQGVMYLVDAHGRERYIEYHDVIRREGPTAVVRGIAHEVTERVTRARNQEQMLDGITLAMADLVESRDPYTSGHQKRVAEIAVTLARRMGFPPERLRPLFIAASLHDIGKISVPTEILSKPAPLSNLERQFIEQHPQVGADILRRVPFPWNVATSSFATTNAWTAPATLTAFRGMKSIRNPASWRWPTSTKP
jgi:PAS domain S-box-containing protein/putative nucleotidyltransferase with HDIG domain